MKKKIYICLFFCCLGYMSYTQENRVITHNDFSAQTLVADIFANGACENIDLIEPVGDTGGIGYFENAAHIIGLNSGIILSTGPTHHANGPNGSTDASGDFNDGSGDADLNHLATARIRDAVGIEFDFVPLDSFVSFRYVFASEEYCEFVGSQYNDVFGFFISGPGIEGTFNDGAENIALIPGSNDFVAINTVNFNQNDQYYVHNERENDLNSCGLQGIETSHLDEIEYDGFTTVLTAVTKLHPCETYHIRLVVSDVADAFFDSAVFLEAGSFNIGGEVTVEAISSGPNAGQVYEGCEDAFFRFSRTADSPVDNPLTVDFNLSPASTASSGIDFETLPSSVTIPAGDHYIDLPFYSWYDDVDEGAEFVRLVLDIPCACYIDSTEITILPKPALEIEMEDDFACPNEQAILAPSISGGLGPYSFSWDNGGQEPSQGFDAVEGAWHWVMVVDQCGQQVLDSAQIWLTEAPYAFLADEQSICQGDTAQLNLDITGIPPFNIGYTLNGGEVQYQSIADSNGFLVTSGGYYELIEIEDAACTALGDGEAFVNIWEVAAEPIIQNPSCAGRTDGQLSINTTAGTSPFQYFWEDQNVDAVMTGLAEGLYEIEIVDHRDCSAFYFWELVDPEILETPIVDCEALAMDNYIPQANGGTPPYEYAIDGSSWLGSNWYNQLVEGEEIQLAIQDANGCSLETTWRYPISFPEGMFSLPPVLELGLGTQWPISPEWFIPLDFISSVNWSPSDQLSCNDCLDPILNAVADQSITMLVTNVFGCQDSIDFDLRVTENIDVFIPNVFSPNGDENNDSWHIYGNPFQVERIHELMVFDRWGNYIFHATDWPINSERHGWDGYYRGVALDPAVFAYQITFKLVNGEYRTISGDLTLLR